MRRRIIKYKFTYNEYKDKFICFINIVIVRGYIHIRKYEKELGGKNKTEISC